MIEHIGKNKAKFIINVGSGRNRKRKTKVITYSGKKDLENKYRQFEAEARRKALSDITIDELIRGYIDNRKVMGAKATTLKGYKVCLERFNGSLRYEKAREVEPYLLEDFVAQNANKWSAKTVRNTMGLLSASYTRAIRLGLLDENPCERITLPKSVQPEIKTFSEEQTVLFMELLKKERLDFKVGYELCLMCGLRRSEVLGLRECDFDSENGTVSIHQTRHIVEGERQIQDTKTARSRRVLALPEVLKEDIKALIALHDSYDFEHSDYLILTGFGEEMHPSTFSEHLKHVEKKHDLPIVSVHGLRHTFATMLNADGVDIARISAELGHSNITTTLNKYTHVFGGTTASSRGIADGMNRKFDNSATFLPPSGKEKPLNLENSAV